MSLQDLREALLEGGRYALVEGWQQGPVDIAGHSDRRVAEPLLDRLDMRSGFDEQSGGGRDLSTNVSVMMPTACCSESVTAGTLGVEGALVGAEACEECEPELELHAATVIASTAVTQPIRRTKCCDLGVGPRSGLAEGRSSCAYASGGSHPANREATLHYERQPFSQLMLSLHTNAYLHAEARWFCRLSPVEPRGEK